MSLFKKSNWVLNLGLNDKDTHKQEKSMEEVYRQLGIIFNKHGCTITECIGFYKGEKEKSLKIECYDMLDITATTIARRLANTFNQECVYLTEMKTNHTEFITNNLKNIAG